MLSLPEPYEGCIPVTDVLGELETECRPKIVRAANGEIYLGKRNGMASDGRNYPYAAQEFLCARLASLCGVPIPEFDPLCFEGEIWFGSRYASSKLVPFSIRLLDRVSNPEAIYNIAAFDVWVQNSDRHEDNLIGIRVGDDYRLVAIDHSHCPLSPEAGIDALRAVSMKTADRCIHRCYRRAITEKPQLEDAIRRIQSISDDSIFDSLDGCPSAPWTEAEVTMIQRFLCDRRDSLRVLVNGAGAVIPALQEGPL